MKRILIGLFVFVNIAIAQTQNEIESEIKRFSQNIGFIKMDKKQNLKKEFSFCDEFLDVHWFDKKINKPQRGYLEYTYFEPKYNEKLKEYVLSDKKITVTELVEVQEDGNLKYYGLYFLQKAFPNNWKEIAQEVNITGNNKQFTFHYESKKYEVSGFRFLIADHYMNICVVKPDKTALFYEMKFANKVLNDEEQDRLITKIKADGIELEKNTLNNFIPLDINNDGINDLLHINLPYIVFSDKKKYIPTIRNDIWINGDNFFQYQYFNEKRICNLLFGSQYSEYYSYDGKYLYRKQRETTCNLTQLTKEIEE